MKPARSLGGDGDLGDGQRRGVGGQDGVISDDLVQRGEHLALQLQPLDHGLDHQVALGERLQRRGERDPVEQRLLLVDAQLAALHRSVGGVLDVPATALGRVLVALHADHGQPVPREHLGDPGAHRTETDHTHRLQCPSHAPNYASPPTGPPMS